MAGLRRAIRKRMIDSMMKRVLLVFLLAAAAVSWAQDDQQLAVRARNKARVDAEYRQKLAEFGKDDDYLVLPGLLADRSAKKIHVSAEATGLGADNTVEFFLIGENSGHDYEALAVSFAEPGAIHSALCFIGMSSGRPVNPAKLQFWPKGERVLMSFASEARPEPVRAEHLMIDKRTGRPLEETGFVFAGSTGLRPGEDPRSEAYAANSRDPMSIAANYNEPESVLDVPRLAAQGEVYDNQLVNPACAFAPGEFLDVAFEPEHKDGRKRVMDLLLEVKPSTAGPTNEASGGSLVFELSEGGKTLVGNAALPAVLKEFTVAVDAGRDTFVTVRFDDRLMLCDVKPVCAVLAAIDTESGIRVEPPPEGRLYYKAFLTDESFRNREERISQPWELRLKAGDEGVEGVLTRIEQLWIEGKTWPDLKLHHSAVPTADSLRKELDEQGPGLPVIIVFAEAGVSYGQLLDFIALVLPTHGTVYVFAEPG